jgi:foldase protein PrsA
VKQIIGMTLIVLLVGGVTGGILLAGAKTPDEGKPAASATIDPNQVAAMVNGKPITMAELQKPLMEAYGLKVLLFEIRLNMAKQLAADKKIEVTQADFDAELARTEKGAFQDAGKEDYPQLLAQLLEKQGASRPEFDMAIQTNAILRKVAEPMLKDKITEANIEEAFKVLYGETVSVKHIQCSTPQEAMQAKTRLASGEKFEAVVHAMSHLARSRDLDGELPPFSRQSVNWGSGWGPVPQGFKDWAFNAKVGDLSDPIQSSDGYHILKLENRLAPKAVKLAAVHNSIKANLEDQLMTQGIKELREKLAQVAQQSMVIVEPTLKKQYEDKITEQSKAAEERARQDVLSRIKTTTEPTTRTFVDPYRGKLPEPQGTSGTSAVPTAGTTASPTDASTGERPPATKSAEPLPADNAPKATK